MSHGQIRALHKGRIDAVFAWHTGNDVHTDASASGRGIAPVRVYVVGVLLAVNLLHDSVVKTGQQVAPDDFRVWLPAVSSDLNTARNPLLHVCDKRLSVRIITFARVVYDRISFSRAVTAK